MMKKVKDVCVEKLRVIRSFSAYLMIWALMLCLYTVIAGSMPANDGFWHMTIGRYIWNNGAIPSTAVGAWGGDSLSWLPQEWLYEVVVYGLFKDNMIAMCVFTFVLFAIMLFIVGIFARLHKNIFRKPVGVIAYAILSLFCLLSFVVPRPQSLSVLLAVLFVHRLRHMVYIRNAKWYDYLYFLCIGVVWANIHAGTAILGYLIPIGIGIGYMITDKFVVFQNYFCVNHSPKAINRISWIGCIMLLSCFLTPHGISGFLYPIQSMGDGMMLQVVAEWASPDVNDLHSLLMYYLPLFVFVLWLFFSRTKMDLYDILVVGFFFVLGCLHVRLILYLLPVLMMLWIPYMKIGGNWESKIKGCSFPAFCSLCMTVFCLLVCTYQLSLTDLMSEGYGNDEFFETVKEYSGERLYNYYDIGSVLQYYDIPVFVDARYDPYADERMVDFVRTQYCDSQSNELNEVMVSYDFTSILDLQGSSPILWANEHGYVCKAVWNTGKFRTDVTGTEPLIYELWVKES